MKFKTPQNIQCITNAVAYWLTDCIIATDSVVTVGDSSPVGRHKILTHCQQEYLLVLLLFIIL